jgi:O-antigen/teichoic acid export membrane protein
VSLRRNTVFGALGFVVPTIVLVLAYPYILRHLGPQAMGLFLLSTTVSGSLAFLEFGVSTATVKLLAERTAGNDGRGAADVVATSLVFYGALGSVGSVLFWVLAPWLARWSGAGPELEGTAVIVLRIAAVQFVPSYANGVLGSALKGFQRFEWSTLQVSLMSTLVWGGAVAGIALFGLGVVGVAAVSLAVTVAACILSAWLAWRVARGVGVDLLAGRARRGTLRSMLRFGVFMAVNGMAGVLMLQVQTWLIAALLGAVAVTVFSTALQISSKINGLMNAMFEPVMPVAAAMMGARDPVRLGTLRAAYNKAMGASVALSVSAAVALYAIAPLLMAFWLRSAIDGQVATVVRILCIGLAVNGATPVAYHLMNGLGRPETNTAFMVAGIVLFYGVLGAFWASGSLDLPRFAAAMSGTLFLNGLAYLAYAEFVVWRRLLRTAS